jgi:hypothetical protein
MLEHYKKTFVGTQITIGVITLAVLIRTHRLVAALAFFVTMQLGAILGAMWAVRIKHRIEQARRNKTASLSAAR